MDVYLLPYTCDHIPVIIGLLYFTGRSIAQNCANVNNLDAGVNIVVFRDFDSSCNFTLKIGQISVAFLVLKIRNL